LAKAEEGMRRQLMAIFKGIEGSKGLKEGLTRQLKA